MSGYRLAVEYDLLHRSALSAVGLLPPSPPERNFTLSFRNLLRAWLAHLQALETTVSAPDFIVHPLADYHSTYGVDFQHLRGPDRAKVSAICAIAAELGFAVHLASLGVWVSGPAKCHMNDGGGVYEMTAVTRLEYVLRNAVARDGTKIYMRNFAKSQDHIVPTLELDGLVPDMVDDLPWKGEDEANLSH